MRPSPGVPSALTPPATRLYAVGDIHGRLDLLEQLLAAIREDALGSRASRRVLVFLGDYVDRGPHSAEVVELLANGPPGDAAWRGFRWICLKGNHEAAMLDFVEGRTDGQVWLANGGFTAVESYSGLPCRDVEQPEDWRIRLRDSLPARHRDFLSALPVHHAEGDYLFVHAGLRPGIPLADQEARDLLWIRGTFLSSPADHGYLVVHGHSIVEAPEIHPNRIAIDTGAYHSGRLTALVAEGSWRGFLST